jgi:hypothetical protein
VPSLADNITASLTPADATTDDAHALPAAQ